MASALSVMVAGNDSLNYLSYLSFLLHEEVVGKFSVSNGKIVMSPPKGWKHKLEAIERDLATVKATVSHMEKTQGKSILVDYPALGIIHTAVAAFRVTASKEIPFSINTGYKTLRTRRALKVLTKIIRKQKENFEKAVVMISHVEQER